ncbi:hypothetical protein FRX31_034617, partial [Thalictrum thalictroides]
SQASSEIFILFNCRASDTLQISSIDCTHVLNQLLEFVLRKLVYRLSLKGIPVATDYGSVSTVAIALQWGRVEDTTPSYQCSSDPTHFNWLVTHNAFSIVNSPSLSGVQRITFYKQEDSVTTQLRV